MIRADVPLPLRRNKQLLALLAVCALLAVFYNFTVAVGYGPDEPRHMNYVRLLLDEHTFPRLLPDGTEYKGAHSLHPPLYYGLLVPFFALARPFMGEGSWHLLRLVSAALCLGSLGLLYDVALRFGSRRLALLATAQVGLLPLWGMIAGVINNDSAALFAQSLLVWLLAVRFPRDKTLRTAALLGAVVGVGALCKATNIICGGVALVIFLILQSGGMKMAVRDRMAWARLGVALGVALVVCGAWYARALMLYGQLTPIEAGYTNAALGAAPRFGALTVLMHPAFLPLLMAALWGIFYSMWAQKDWIPEALRLPVYVSLSAYSAVAVAGNLRARFSPRRDGKAGNLSEVEGVPVASMEKGGRVPNVVRSPVESDDALPARIALWCSLGAFIVNVAACAAIAVFKHWGWAEGGRYLLLSVGGASLWAACGWRALVGERGLRVVLVGWCAAMLAFNGVALYWLITFLNPTYVK